MDYLRFVELRSASCDRFERRLQAATENPAKTSYADLENLALHYRQILHDHALASERYPGTSMARRLERLAMAGTHWLQRDSADHLPGLRRFLSHSFPLSFRRSLPAIAVLAGLFLFSVLFGFALTVAEPAMGTFFLPPDALAELRQGSLWTESIFSTTPGSVMSSVIATNNLSVAMTGWAGGALAGLGALYVAFLNGLMLGSVFALTAHYSMAPALLNFISAHGPLEISLILVTGGAGLGVGQALVFAGDRPRVERIVHAGRSALIVLLGCLPWFVVLGFVEGFISPLPGVSIGVKAMIGLLLELCFLTVAWNPWASDLSTSGVLAATSGATRSGSRKSGGFVGAGA
jgi:uncharacterized membrane protein SpoIIM required for sporulation